jgi:hypothetical protein
MRNEHRLDVDAGSDGGRQYSESERGTGEAIAFTCDDCRATTPWLLSCIHTWGRTPAYQPERFAEPCQDPDGVARACSAWKSVPGPAEPERFALPITMPLAVRRWLWLGASPVDHGNGRTGPGWYSTEDWRGRKYCPARITYGKDELTFLRTHRYLNDDGTEGALLVYDECHRRGRGEYVRPGGLQESATETAGSDFETADKIKTRRKRVEACYAESRHVFLKNWASRVRLGQPLMGTKKQFRRVLFGERHREQPKLPKLPTSTGWPRFTTAALSDEGRFRRDIELALDKIDRRRARLYDEVPLATTEVRTSGWGHQVGVRRASRLLKTERARARAENARIGHVDLWTASEAGYIPERGWLPPIEFVAYAATAYVGEPVIGGWTTADLTAFDWFLHGRARSCAWSLQHRLREYKPKDFDSFSGRPCRRPVSRPPVGEPSNASEATGITWIRSDSPLGHLSGESGGAQSPSEHQVQPAEGADPIPGLGPVCQGGSR